MRLSRFTRGGFAAFAALVVIFLIAPLLVIILFAFDASNVQTFPIHHWTLSWFSVAWHDPAVRSSLWLSVKAGVLATIIALILGIIGLGKARALNVGRGLAITGLVLGIVSLLAALFITVVVTVFIGRHAKILDCGRNDLTQAQQQQCVRDQLGLPSVAPS